MAQRTWLGSMCLILMATAMAAQDKGKIVEEVVARVNNDVITQGDLDRAQSELVDETQQECRACTPAQIQEKMAPHQTDLLRDLIDSSLLVQRAKDMAINVDTDVIKRLDETRLQNNLASMEDLEKSVTASGRDFEDFKANIRNQLLTQEVIRREVGSKVVVDHAEIMKYYEDHKAEFVRPEQVIVREIFVSTEGKTDAETPALQKKADGLLQRVKDGEDFGELAKRFSDGTTAKQGGDLGTFEHGQLARNLEDIVFKLTRNQVTDVLPTKTGFLILQVRDHFPAGQQPEDKVDNEITDRLYGQRVQPALRTYLATLRREIGRA